MKISCYQYYKNSYHHAFNLVILLQLLGSLSQTSTGVPPLNPSAGLLSPIPPTLPPPHFHHTLSAVNVY